MRITHRSERAQARQGVAAVGDAGAVSPAGAASRRLAELGASALGTLAAALLLAWSTWSVADERDEMAQKLLACAGCHEYSGTGRTSYAPSISGKPVEYLYQQLRNYREGRRLNEPMGSMLAYLDDDYLHAIADHYARLPADDFREEPRAGERSPAELAMGERLVRAGSSAPACASCHGNDLRGDGVAIPSLRGLSAIYITAQLGAWRTNTRHARPPDCMREVANRLSGVEVGAVAHWIAQSFEMDTAPPPPETELPLPCGALQ